MNKDSKDIGDLFKSGLQNYKAEISEEEWLATEIQIKGKNFFRFSVSNFNIYYCTLFLTSFVLSSIVFVDYYFGKGKAASYPVKEEVIVPLKNSLPEDNSKQNTMAGDNGTTIRYTTSSKKPAKKTSCSANNSPQNNLVISQDTVKKNDNVILTPVENTTIPSVKSTDSAATIQKPKPKKIIYITRQDTVRVYDTLDAKKTRKRKK